MRNRAWRRRGVLGLVLLGVASGCNSPSSQAVDSSVGETSGSASDTGSSSTGPSDTRPSDTRPSDTRPGDAAVTTGSSSSTPASSDAQTPDLLEGLVATIEGQTVDFRNDMQTYNGRPPTMDVSAGSDDPTWLTLRVFVAPVGDGPIERGEYPCGEGKSWLMLISGAATYVSYEVPGTCTVHVIDPGVLPGEIFSGTFSGTVVKSDGSSPLTITEGTFYGVVD